MWGTFTAIGTISEKIIFNSTRLYSESNSSIVNVNFSEYNGGLIRHGGGSMVIEDSKINNLGSFYISYPSGGASIERNIFINSSGMHVVTSGDVQIYVRNNVFYNQLNYAVSNDANYGTSNTIVEYNSFLSTDRIAMALDGDNALMTARNNYWNTTDKII